MSAAQPAPVSPSLEPLPVPPKRGMARAIAGFFVSGLLMAFPGAILPAWQAELAADFTDVGKYFLALALGILAGLWIAPRLVRAKGVSFALVSATSVAAAAVLFLGWAGPPSPEGLRLLGMAGAGVGAAILNLALFQAVAPLYERDRAATINLAGALFGLGGLITALLVAQTFYALAVPAILTLLAAIPAGFAILFAGARYPASAPAAVQPHQGWKDLRNPLAAMVGLLLFFQFGSELSIAGWLPLFLMRRLGISPAAALLMLACYWATLLGGRFAAQAILPKGGHRRILLGSVGIELFGYLLLTATNNVSGAAVGILCLATGYSVTYPLLAERIGGRIPHFHPGLFQGIFSFAFAGALLAPWLLGYLAQAWGIAAVMLLPLCGTLAVFLLLPLIMLEGYLTGLASARKTKRA